MNILVSACLLGCNSKYSGENSKNDALIEFVKGNHVIPVCPEQLGGLTTPRPPAEIIVDGTEKVIDEEGNDLTEPFQKGADETLYLAELLEADIAILKESSPSCGSNTVYDGTFSGVKMAGQGFTARLLASKGIKVYSEENFVDIKAE